MLGRTRIRARSSTAWWEPPSGPTVTPPWVATILTLTEE